MFFQISVSVVLKKKIAVPSSSVVRVTSWREEVSSLCWVVTMMASPATRRSQVSICFPVMLSSSQTLCMVSPMEGVFAWALARDSAFCSLAFVFLGVTTAERACAADAGESAKADEAGTDAVSSETLTG